jgi:2-keto-4-pentenoate hydratase/2-oxohepta-3-ene-1,7-dioic acid hydratase in catechol pathway
MRVAVYERNGDGAHVGIADGDELVDVTSWVGALGCCPLAAYLARASESSPPDDGVRIPLADVDLLPPAIGAATLLCAGLNYADHAEEVKVLGLQAGEYPALHSRYWPTVVGHGRPIVRPTVSEALDFEGELVVIIGQQCRNVARDRAFDVIAGYTIGQEGSVRDWQRRAPTPVAGKNFASSGAMGPFMVTPDELDPTKLDLTTAVNGETLQKTNTALMMFDIPTIIEYVTAFMPLFPGDAIFTGTPSGTFGSRTPQRWLVPGDVVTVEISGVGKLENPVVAEDDVAR